MVFFADKETTKEYMDFFFLIEPFKNYPNKFNFFFIDDYKPECELYKGIAILCYSKELLKKASSCPNDYIFVVDKHQEVIRSSAYMNVLSINKNHPLTVLMHEFGHAFANFAEEYVPAKIPRGSKNCVSNCDKFNGLNEDCSSGCSESHFLRSIDEGIMRSLSSTDYGTFDENLILERLKTISDTATDEEPVIDGANEEHYMVEAIYNPETEEIEIINQELVKGYAGTNGYGKFDVSSTGDNEQHTSQGSFNALNIFTDAPDGDSIDGEVFESDDSFYLTLDSEVEDIEISYEDSNGNSHTLNAPITTGARPCQI